MSAVGLGAVDALAHAGVEHLHWGDGVFDLERVLLLHRFPGRQGLVHVVGRAGKAGQQQAQQVGEADPALVPGSEHPGVGSDALHLVDLGQDVPVGAGLQGQHCRQFWMLVHRRTGAAGFGRELSASLEVRAPFLPLSIIVHHHPRPTVGWFFATGVDERQVAEPVYLLEAFLDRVFQDDGVDAAIVPHPHGPLADVGSQNQIQ